MVQVAKSAESSPPSHGSDLAAALAGKDQHVDDRAVGDTGLAGGRPNLGDLLVAQHPLALFDARREWIAERGSQAP
jgi:hypothetical protein